MLVSPADGTSICTFVERVARSGLPMRLLHFPFPSVEAGLPEDTENDSIVHASEIYKLLAVAAVRETHARILWEHRPDAVVAGFYYRWANDVSRGFSSTSPAPDGQPMLEEEEDDSAAALPVGVAEATSPKQRMTPPWPSPPHQRPASLSLSLSSDRPPSPPHQRPASLSLSLSAILHQLATITHLIGLRSTSAGGGLLL